MECGKCKRNIASVVNAVSCHALLKGHFDCLDSFGEWNQTCKNSEINQTPSKLRLYFKIHGQSLV